MLSVFLFTFSRHLYLSLALLVLVGAFMITFLATANTLLQIRGSDELRGRIMGFFVMALLGMSPLGSLQVGLLAQHLGAPWAIRIGIAICFLSWLILFRTVRQIDGEEKGTARGPGISPARERGAYPRD